MLIWFLFIILLSREYICVVYALKQNILKCAYKYNTFPYQHQVTKNQTCNM